VGLLDSIPFRAMADTLGYAVGQAVPAWGAALAGRSKGEEEARKRREEDAERAARARERTQQEAARALEMESTQFNLDQKRNYNPATDPQVQSKLYLQEREPNGFELDGHRFDTSAEALAYYRQKRVADESIRDRFRPPPASRGGAGGIAGGGITAGVRRERDYWARVAEDYVRGAGGDVNNALALVHRNPEHRAARLRGDLSNEMFWGARARLPARSDAVPDGGMTFDQGYKALNDPEATHAERWKRLTPVEQRNAVERLRRGQDPFAAPQRAAPGAGGVVTASRAPERPSGQNRTRDNLTAGQADSPQLREWKAAAARARAAGIPESSWPPRPPR